MKLYEQQDYMYRNRTHRVECRIVSLSQQWLRPIMRGKTAAPVEFGEKLDIRVKTGVTVSFMEYVCQDRKWNAKEPGTDKNSKKDGASG